MDAATLLLTGAIEKYRPLADAEKKQISLSFTDKKYARGTLLLREGEVAHDVFFIIKGCARQYYTDEKGTERTCTLSIENEFITNLESFSRQTPSTTFIEALTPLWCKKISCGQLSGLMKTCPNIADFFRITVEQIAMENFNRIKNLLSVPPEKQYEELQEKRPELLQRVPQRYIAQYIGVAPESLSRIKKRKYKGPKS